MTPSEGHGGASLLEHLESVQLENSRAAGSMRFPVQYVIRPDASFRGYAGQIVSGTIHPGDPLMVLPSGRTSRIKSIATWDGDLTEAFAPMAVTICLEDQLDVSRGDMLVPPAQLPHVSRRFEATLVWMNEKPLKLGQPVLLKQTTQQLPASVTELRHRVNINTLAEEKANSLEMNEIGRVVIETTRPIFFDPYLSNRWTGNFIMIDPITNATVAAGMILEPQQERSFDRIKSAALLDVEFRTSRLTPAERYARAGHYPAILWLTARQDLAFLLEAKLFQRGCQVHVISEQAESRILPELAALLTAAGLISVFSVSNGDRAEQDRARAQVGANRFFEFEPQSLPASDEAAAEQICALLEARGIIPRDGRFMDADGI